MLFRSYMEDDALVAKFLTLGESVHSESVEYQLREMLSSGELSRLVTTKDEVSGKMASHMVRKKVRVAMVMSTTESRINEENASRSFLISTDESQSQTEAIHRRQREKYSFEAYRKRKEAIPAIIARHQAAQRLIKPTMIVNPFAPLLSFPSSQMRTRRDHERFIDLISAVCFLRQYQKELRKSPPGSEGTGGSYIECDIEDYRIAHGIIMQVLPGVLSGLPKSAMLLHGQIRELAMSKATRESLSFDEVIFTQRELREYSRASHDVVKRNLRFLVDYEYIEAKGGRSGSRYQYRMMAKGLPVDSSSSLPSPLEIEREMGKRGSGVVAGQ